MVISVLLPTDICFRDLDQKLCIIHRELRFIARTIARLRNRHNAALVFSSTKPPYHKNTYGLQNQVSAASLAMWRKLFPSHRHSEPPLDVESAPATPTCERPPSWIDLKSPAATPRDPDAYFALTPAATPKFEDEREIIVDERSPSLFSIPETWIPSSVRSEGMSSTPPSPIPQEISAISLADVSTTQFFDYIQWRKTGRILQYPHNNVEYAIEQQGRTLISALSCGVSLKNSDYQRAAMQEFLHLAPLLSWPEDYVNSVFSATATKGQGDRPHPARQMIVAIVAAKTCGNGKRKVRQGPREKGVMRGDRIETGTFWSLYDAYCATKGPECAWPRSVDEFIME